MPRNTETFMFIGRAIQYLFTLIVKICEKAIEVVEKTDKKLYNQ